MKVVLSLCAALVLAWPGAALAKTEIHFWHAMTGALGDALETQVKQFNESQAEYEVKPLRKGSYPETLTAAIAAYRQKNPPHLVQVAARHPQLDRGPGVAARIRREIDVQVRPVADREVLEAYREPTWLGFDQSCLPARKMEIVRADEAPGKRLKSDGGCCRGSRRRRRGRRRSRRGGRE